MPATAPRGLAIGEALQCRATTCLDAVWPLAAGLARGYTSRIASLAASQITGGDITSIRIDDKVELAPSAVLGRLAHVPAMNLDAGTVHEDVNRSVMAGPVERDLAESLGTSREGCLVRNLQCQSVYLYQRQQAALGLSPREMKHHAKRQRGLDCQVRVLALSTSFPAWWGGPLTDGFVGEPEGQRAAGDQSLIIGRPVRDLVSLLDVLGLAPLETAHRGSGMVVSRIFRTFRSASLGLSCYAADSRRGVCTNSAVR